jgi:hypothetical protein
VTSEAGKPVDPTVLLVDVAAQLEVDLERLERSVDEAAREIAASESPEGGPDA